MVLPDEDDLAQPSVTACASRVAVKLALLTRAQRRAFAECAPELFEVLIALGAAHRSEEARWAERNPQ